MEEETGEQRLQKPAAHLSRQSILDFHARRHTFHGSASPTANVERMAIGAPVPRLPVLVLRDSFSSRVIQDHQPERGREVKSHSKHVKEGDECHGCKKIRALSGRTLRLDPDGLPAGNIDGK
jgi:hypothetical protein